MEDVRSQARAHLDIADDDGGTTAVEEALALGVAAKEHILPALGRRERRQDLGCEGRRARSRDYIA